MAIQPHSLRACLVSIDANQAAGLKALGYTEDGADVSLIWYRDEVKSDDYGGVQGPTADHIDLGQSATIQLVFARWDEAIMDSLDVFNPSSTRFSPGTPGDLLYTDSSKNFRLLLQTTNQPMNFVTAIPIGPINTNMGVRHARKTIQFAAFENGSGVLWNETTA